MATLRRLDAYAEDDTSDLPAQSLLRRAAKAEAEKKGRKS